jgi:hypothetical protein
MFQIEDNIFTRFLIIIIIFNRSWMKLPFQSASIPVCFGQSISIWHHTFFLIRPCCLPHPLGYHSSTSRVHLPSILLAVCLAHCHFSFSTRCTMSDTLVMLPTHVFPFRPLFIIPSMHLSMLLCVHWISRSTLELSIARCWIQKLIKWKCSFFRKRPILVSFFVLFLPLYIQSCSPISKAIK